MIVHAYVIKIIKNYFDFVDGSVRDLQFVFQLFNIVFDSQFQFDQPLPGCLEKAYIDLVDVTQRQTIFVVYFCKEYFQASIKSDWLSFVVLFLEVAFDLLFRINRKQRCQRILGQLQGVIVFVADNYFHHCVQFLRQADAQRQVCAAAQVVAA